MSIKPAVQSVSHNSVFFNRLSPGTLLIICLLSPALEVILGTIQIELI